MQQRSSARSSPRRRLCLVWTVAAAVARPLQKENKILTVAKVLSSQVNDK